MTQDTGNIIANGVELVATIMERVADQDIVRPADHANNERETIAARIVSELTAREGV
ncbi:hypothetical protein PP187_gp186 [Klebsiella phage vB_KvM-Eowyn]|jgi:hypothetical protein|uniref:Uncharacterized protein n=1 Tax=Klebsiella phage vB_KvM-Eowyn TaxID=2762819 RepID=A0A7R8R546_9CAUD|nr:hypothetical protein PP187_gp186 [Klebsiella phage vB_KvM-Eowyn]UVX43094.1 MAG: hypothetical protein [Bacteriophage sp.]CAD5236175.1 hypothetical protein LLCLJKAH_00186 [Klebsiella phage vB_KvM-Eowyn]